MKIVYFISFVEGLYYILEHIILLDILHYLFFPYFFASPNKI
jgi:hypothetical protein